MPKMGSAHGIDLVNRLLDLDIMPQNMDHITAIAPTAAAGRAAEPTTRTDVESFFAQSPVQPVVWLDLFGPLLSTDGSVSEGVSLSFVLDASVDFDLAFRDAVLVVPEVGVGEESFSTPAVIVSG
jgi:hypothetical protein